MARILLADDDAATRDLVKRALESQGHSVLVTQDGNEALDEIKSASAPFDVLVSDVDMPMLDGLTLAQRAHELHPNIRILMMSGFADQLERAKALSGPAVSVISKPFSLDQVRDSVKQLLG